MWKSSRQVVASTAHTLLIKDRWLAYCQDIVYKLFRNPIHLEDLLLLFLHVKMSKLRSESAWPLQLYKRPRYIKEPPTFTDLLVSFAIIISRYQPRWRNEEIEFYVYSLRLAVISVCCDLQFTCVHRVELYVTMTVVLSQARLS